MTKSKAMEKGGQKLGKILDELILFSKPGVSLLEIDSLAEKLIDKEGGTPSFKTVKNYQYSTCLCLNDIVVHGLPTSYRLNIGDLLGIDIGLFYKGFHTDCAWTKIIGKTTSAEIAKFIQTGKLALKRAINKATVGNRIWDIGKAIEETIEEAGYAPVRALTGHGIGGSLHEDPQIPCFTRGEREKSPEIKEGQALAIEVIYNMGTFGVVYKNADGWTISTEDKSISGLFEHTVLVTKKGPQVLTQSVEFDKIQS